MRFLIPNADDEDAACGKRDWQCWPPGEGWGEVLGLRELGMADQEGEAACGGDQAGCDWEDASEVLDCAEGYYFDGRVGEVLGASGKDIDVRQCEFAGDLAQEGCFLLVGLDQGEVDFGCPDFYGKSGEAGA